MTPSRPRPKTWLTPAEITSLVQAEHATPHDLLGMHSLGEGLGQVVRTLRPDAAKIALVPDEGPTVRPTMNRIHPAGLFELQLPDRKEPFGFRYEIETHEGDRITLRDPYVFLPTLGEVDLHLIGEGRHEALYEVLGAQVRTEGTVRGVSFAVWAPAARRVSVVGDWNRWDGRYHMMRSLGASGIWEILIPGLEPGALYRYEILKPNGYAELRSDPLDFAAELRPKVASRIADLTGFEWTDREWMEARAARDPARGPVSVYEVHLGSWMRHPDHRWLSYRELAEKLPAYVKDLGFTHVELMPVSEYPFDGSWGYQVTGYYAATSRYGSPQDFMALVDACHREGLGVILDWVPAHFPRDAFALARFDGTELYEHADPRQGEHPDWGTLVFNYGRHEVRNFLIGGALFWLDRYHIDGLRVDAVASMLYLDYSRGPGEWIPNRYGGRENLEAIEFLKEMNAVVHRRFPGVLTIAEESTAWPGVSRPTAEGGLGFSAKWNMGFMHDMLAYFHEDPIHRKFHHDKLTFGLLYAFNENFVLPFSHDEVVHGKGSMVAKMPGDDWRRFANLRALYAYTFAHPGKKLLFMGSEFGQWREWNHEDQLEWYVLEYETHRGLRECVKRLASVYRNEPALWARDDDWQGFQWIDFSDADDNVVSWVRRGKEPGEFLVCAFNLSPVPRTNYRIGAPEAGAYREILNTDLKGFGGSGMENSGVIPVEPTPAHGFDRSIVLTLPPLGGVYLKPVVESAARTATPENPPSEDR